MFKIIHAKRIVCILHSSNLNASGYGPKSGRNESKTDFNIVHYRLKIIFVYLIADIAD